MRILLPALALPDNRSVNQAYEPKMMYHLSQRLSLLCTSNFASFRTARFFPLAQAHHLHRSKSIARFSDERTPEIHPNVFWICSSSALALGSRLHSTATAERQCLGR